MKQIGMMFGAEHFRNSDTMDRMSSKAKVRIGALIEETKVQAWWPSYADISESKDPTGRVDSSC